MFVVDLFKTLFFGSIPPDSGDSNGVRRWQWVVALKIWALICFAVWSADMIPQIPGMARSTSVRALSDKVGNVDQKLDSLQLSLLEGQLLSARRDQCKAIGQQNNQAVGFYAEKLQDLRNQFFRLTGRIWETPRCEEI